MVNFERPREVQSSLMISVTKYFILNFLDTRQEGEGSSEFGIHSRLRQAHSTEMCSINNLLKNNVVKATYWLKLEVEGSVGNVYSSTITVWVKYRNSWGENSRHCGLLHVIEVVIGWNRLYCAISDSSEAVYVAVHRVYSCELLTFLWMTLTLINLLPRQQILLPQHF